MPITLVDTVGASNANTYRNLALADAYFAERLHSEVWTGETDDEKRKAALATARRRIDQVRYDGYKATDTQSCQWPRIQATDPDRPYQYLADDVIPDAIGDAQCEEAIVLLGADADPAARDALSKFSALTLPGGLSLTLREGQSTNDALSPVATRLLAPYMQGENITYLERA